MISSIPHQEILINALGLQESKDSSAIENIVTTHDELYREDVSPAGSHNIEAKEVYRYRQALGLGFSLVQQSGLITLSHLCRVQEVLTESSASLRTFPGTTLQNAYGETVYALPQSHEEIVRLFGDLEQFVNDPETFDADPLIKMALIHHQFESIHPFYDGNGRTGRILNVLYLVKERYSIFLFYT